MQIDLKVSNKTQKMLLSQHTELKQKNQIIACFWNVWKNSVGSLDYLSSAANA